MFLNEAQISLTGYVATQPVTKMVKSGATYMSMRVAWTPRRQDRVTGEWVDGNTSYVTVICWRKLATNAGLCVRKGDPVIVKGRLSIRTYEDKQGVQRNAVEVEANSVGHDLSRGVALFQRVRPQTGLTASEYAASNGGQPTGDAGEYAAAADVSAEIASAVSANGLSSLPDGDSEAVLGPSAPDLPQPGDPGVEDPFFDSSSDNQAAEREQVATPF
jgi:single-strand DNA-binding protein